MSFSHQFANRFVRNPAFECHFTAVGHGTSCRIARPNVLNTRSIAGFLNIHLKVNNITYDLHMALWLHVATHYAKAHKGFAIFSYKCGNNSMEWPFVWLVNIHVALFKREKFSAVLEDKSQPAGCHSRAHSPEIALDQRNHVSLFIGSGQVNGVAVFHSPGRITACGTVRINHSCLFFAISFRNKFFYRKIIKIRIGIIPGTIFKSQFFCLHKMVYIIH